MTSLTEIHQNFDTLIDEMNELSVKSDVYALMESIENLCVAIERVSFASREEVAQLKHKMSLLQSKAKHNHELLHHENRNLVNNMKKIREYY